MGGITPNQDAFQKLAQSNEAGPVVMINLLKFKTRAEGEEGTGAEAYGRYADAVGKMLAERGARMIWAGRPEHLLVGDSSDEWDAAALVEYPSRQAFVEMVSSAEYQKIHAHREAGLERTVLIACKPGLERDLQNRR